MTKKVRLVLSLLGEENVTEGINGGGSDALRIPDGEPYAGKLHVWFDEGADSPARGVLLNSTPSYFPRVFKTLACNFQGQEKTNKINSIRSL